MNITHLLLPFVCFFYVLNAISIDIINDSQCPIEKKQTSITYGHISQRQRQQIAKYITKYIQKLIIDEQKNYQEVSQILENQFSFILSLTKKQKLFNSNILPKQMIAEIQKLKKMLLSFIKTEITTPIRSQFEQLYEALKKQLALDITSVRQSIQKIISKINPKKLNQWELVAHPQLEKQYFGITVSNGIIGAISSKDPYQVSQTVLAGNYDKLGRGNVDNLVQSFPILNFRVSCVSNDLNFKQTLNMKEAKMTGQLSNLNCGVKYTYYALKNLPFGFYTSIQIKGHKNMQVTIKNIHQAPAYMTSFLKNYQNVVGVNMLSSIGKAPSGFNEIAMVSAMKMIVNEKQIDQSINVHGNYDSNSHYETLTFDIKQNQTKRLFIMTSVMTNQYTSDPINQAIRVVIRGVTQDQSQLIKAHVDAWAELWKSDIKIVGNSKDQQNVRNMLYHFYSFINPTLNYGLSPMGLSGLGYNGHVFWDMDIWMYPSFLVLHPQLARSLIQYRINRLQGALDNAFINGYKGAMFPWQSSKTGEQQCPVWALSGPLQHHISGCVSFAIWNYYCVTKDVDWLKNKGFNVIRAVADFWMSRVVEDQQGNYHIRNVVGADQWAQNIDDNAFTNAMAIKSLQIVEKASNILKYPINPKWELIREKIVILKFKDIGVTQQHSTYHGQPVKQADVNLLAYPLDTIKDYGAIERDLKYYEARIPSKNVPAMTKAIFSILYNKLGNKTQAYSNFLKAHRPNMRPPFNVMAEVEGGGNPYFLTGAGGALQSLIFGFAGFQITDKGLIIGKKSIPKQWKDINVTGKAIDLYSSRSQLDEPQKQQKINEIQTDLQQYQIHTVEQEQRDDPQ